MSTTGTNGSETGAPADDFTLESIDWRWSLMTHGPCGDVVRFVNPTRDRVDRYRRIHRCGGIDWTGR